MPEDPKNGWSTGGMRKVGESLENAAKIQRKRLSVGDICPTCGGKITETEEKETDPWKMSPKQLRESGQTEGGEWQDFMKEKMKGKDYKGVPF